MSGIHMALMATRQTSTVVTAGEALDSDIGGTWTGFYSPQEVGALSNSGPVSGYQLSALANYSSGGSTSLNVWFPNNEFPDDGFLAVSVGGLLFKVGDALITHTGTMTSFNWADSGALFTSEVNTPVHFLF